MWAPTPASAIDAAIEDMYTQISISPPTTNLVVVCHGFGCRFRTAVGLTNADHSKLKQMFASAKKTPEAERKAIGLATSWFDRRIGPEAGTTRRVAYAGVRSDQGPEQMDCIDMSRNNTSFLLVLDQLGLLKHHKVESSRERAAICSTIAGRTPPRYCAKRPVAANGWSTTGRTSSARDRTSSRSTSG